MSKPTSSNVGDQIFEKVKELQKTWDAAQALEPTMQRETQSFEKSQIPGNVIPPNSNLRYNSRGILYVVGDPNLGYPCGFITI